MTRLESVIRLIDQANTQDPHTEMTPAGPRPKELLYSERMTERLLRFAPQASECLQIAARGQHIERWTSPRSNYPEGRSGYKKWRAELGLYHARRVGELMKEAGYPDTDVARTQYLVQKRGLKRDAESQCLEDVICLVFLEHYLADFAKKHDHDKLIDIIQKTWGKMSETGHEAALQLPLGSSELGLVKEALGA